MSPVMENPLKKEFEFYTENQAELVKKYAGKFIVIKDQEVVGEYETEEDAYFESIQHFEIGTFLIQECLPGEENYTQTFNSRVIFE